MNPTSTLLFASLLFVVVFSLANAQHPEQPKAWPNQWYAVVARNGSSPDGKNHTGPQALQKWYNWDIEALRVECMTESVTSTQIILGFDTWIFNEVNKACIWLRLPVTAVTPDWMVGGDYVGEFLVQGTPSWGWKKLDHLYYQSKFANKPTYVFTPLDNKGYLNDEYYGVFDNSSFDNAIFQVPDYCPPPNKTLSSGRVSSPVSSVLRTNLKKRQPPVPPRGPYDPKGCFLK